MCIQVSPRTVYIHMVLTCRVVGTQHWNICKIQTYIKVKGSFGGHIESTRWWPSCFITGCPPIIIQLVEKFDVCGISLGVFLIVDGQ